MCCSASCEASLYSCDSIRRPQTSACCSTTTRMGNRSGVSTFRPRDRLFTTAVTGLAAVRKPESARRGFDIINHAACRSGPAWRATWSAKTLLIKLVTGRGSAAASALAGAEARVAADRKIALGRFVSAWAAGNRDGTRSAAYGIGVRARAIAPQRRQNEAR